MSKDVVVSSEDENRAYYRIENVITCVALGTEEVLFILEELTSSQAEMLMNDLYSSRKVND